MSITTPVIPKNAYKNLLRSVMLMLFIVFVSTKLQWGAPNVMVAMYGMSNQSTAEEKTCMRKLLIFNAMSNKNNPCTSQQPYYDSTNLFILKLVAIRSRSNHNFGITHQYNLFHTI